MLEVMTDSDQVIEWMTVTSNNAGAVSFEIVGWQKVIPYTP